MASGHAATGALLCGLVGPMIPSPLFHVGTATPGRALAVVAISAAAGAYLALLMDLDTKGKAWHLLQPLSWLLKPLLVGIASVIYWVTRGEKDPEDAGMHRMFTHQPEFALILALVVLFTVPNEWAWWASGVTLVGVWSHRPGDACTKAAVPISLTRVIIRAFRGEERVWLRTGAPLWFRFTTGGKRGKRLFGAKNRRLWDEIGEAVVTLVLIVACGGLGLVTALGFYPL